MHRMNIITLRNAQIAAGMTRPKAPNSADAQTCECGRAMEDIFLTTGGPGCDPAVWLEHPIAVDAWMCEPCGSFRYPRNMTPAQIDDVMNEGVAHGQAGRFIDAEVCFCRVVWDWPGFPPGHLNYAEATRSRLHHTGKDLDPQGQRRLVQRMIDQYEEGVAEATQASPAITRAFLTLIQHAIDHRALDRARRFATQLRGLVALDAETASQADQAIVYVDQRVDLFHAATEVLQPFLDLADRPARAALEPHERKAIADALVDLEEHLRHAPDRWQSAWFYAKALFAAERPADGFAAFERFSQQFPASIEIARDHTMHLLRAGNNARAREINRAIVARHPTEAPMWSNLAVTEMLCGDAAAAGAAVARARELAPDDPIAQAVERRLARGAPFPATLRELEQGR